MVVTVLAIRSTLSMLNLMPLSLRILSTSSSKWFFRYSTVAALLVGHDRRAMTSFLKTSSSILSKPILSNTRSRRRLSPLTKMFSILARNRSVSDISYSLPSVSANISDIPLRRRIHSLPCLTYSSIWLASSLTPMVMHSLKLPFLFSTTTTLVVPDRFFFLLTNMLQKY